MFWLIYQLGREFARMCSVFPAARIIAANSSGERKTDDTVGFISPLHCSSQGAMTDDIVHLPWLRRYRGQDSRKVLLDE